MEKDSVLYEYLVKNTAKISQSNIMRVIYYLLEKQQEYHDKQLKLPDNVIDTMWVNPSVFDMEEAVGHKLRAIFKACAIINEIMPILEMKDTNQYLEQKLAEVLKTEPDKIGEEVPFDEEEPITNTTPKPSEIPRLMEEANKAFEEMMKMNRTREPSIESLKKDEKDGTVHITKGYATRRIPYLEDLAPTNPYLKKGNYVQLKGDDKKDIIYRIASDPISNIFGCKLDNLPAGQFWQSTKNALTYVALAIASDIVVDDEE